MAKKHNKKDVHTKTKENKKQVADSDEENDSLESDMVVKKKPTKKHCQNKEQEAESDVEMVDNDVEVPEVEEIDDHENQSEQDVSINVLLS